MYSRKLNRQKRYVRIAQTDLNSNLHVCLVGKSQSEEQLS